MTVAEVSYAALGLPPGAPLGRELRLRLGRVEAILGGAAEGAGGVVDPSRPPFVAGPRAHALIALLGAARARAARRPATLAAAAVELIAVAGRFHDGVLDGPPHLLATRQGHNAGAVLAGDLLLVRASALAAEVSAEVLRRWAAALAAVQEAKLVGRSDVAGRALRVAALDIGQLAGGVSSNAVPAAPAGR
jgi:hypothetical protein